MLLSVEQIRSFHLNGFLSITEPVTSDEEIAWMREVYDRMFAQKAGWDSGDQFDLAGTDEKGKQEALPQMLNPAKYAPELNDGKFLPVIQDIVHQLLGPEAGVGIAHAIFKPSGHGAATPRRSLLGSSLSIQNDFRLDATAASYRRERVSVVCAGKPRMGSVATSKYRWGHTCSWFRNGRYLSL